MYTAVTDVLINEWTFTASYLPFSQMHELEFLVSTDTERWPEHCTCFLISSTHICFVSGGKSEAQRNSNSSSQLIPITHFCSTGAGQASKCSQLGFITLYGCRNDFKWLISIYRGSLVDKACASSLKSFRRGSLSLCSFSEGMSRGKVHGHKNLYGLEDISPAHHRWGRWVINVQLTWPTKKNLKKET